MLVGDVMVGRVLNAAQRRASARWLGWWLAVPFISSSCTRVRRWRRSWQAAPAWATRPRSPSRSCSWSCTPPGTVRPGARGRVRSPGHLPGNRRAPGRRGGRGDRPRTRNRRARSRLLARVCGPHPPADPSHPASTRPSPCCATSPGDSRERHHCEGSDNEGDDRATKRDHRGSEPADQPRAACPRPDPPGVRRQGRHTSQRPHRVRLERLGDRHVYAEERGEARPAHQPGRRADDRHRGAPARDPAHPRHGRAGSTSTASRTSISRRTPPIR